MDLPAGEALRPPCSRAVVDLSDLQLNEGAVPLDLYGPDEGEPHSMAKANLGDIQIK